MVVYGMSVYKGRWQEQCNNKRQYNGETECSMKEAGRGTGSAREGEDSRCCGAGAAAC